MNKQTKNTLTVSKLWKFWILKPLEVKTDLSILMKYECLIIDTILPYSYLTVIGFKPCVQIEQIFHLNDFYNTSKITWYHTRFRSLLGRDCARFTLLGKGTTTWVWRVVRLDCGKLEFTLATILSMLWKRLGFFAVSVTWAKAWMCEINRSW